MALYNLARCYVANTPGTGNITVGARVVPWITFATAGVATGTVSYAVEDYQVGVTGRIPVSSECGTATYSSVTGILSGRTVTNSSNANGLVNLSSNAEVYITARAQDILNGLTVNTTPITGGTTTNILYDNAGTVGEYTITGTGTVVAMQSSPQLTTPNIGAATATSLNNLTITSSTGTLTIAAGKTLTFSNTLTFVGTDGSTINIGTGGTLGTAAFQNTGTSGANIPFLNGTNTWASGQTFSAAITYGGVTLSNAVTGTGAMVLATSPSLTTPNIGVASGTSLAATGVLSSGANSGTGGQLTLSGSTSGSGVLKVSATAGSGIVFQLPSTNGSNTNVLQTDGSGATSWAAAGAGTVTQIIAGTGLTGGTITSTGTIALDLTRANTWTGALTLSGVPLITSGSFSAAAWTTAGVRIKSAAASYTDTTSSGAVTAAYTDLYGASTILATSSTTYANYYGAYYVDPVASTNVTMTAKWSLGADSLYVGTSNPLKVTTTGVLTATSSVLTTPNVGVATATSVNKLVIIAPATASTLTIADAKTLTVSNTTTIAGGDANTLAIAAAKTLTVSNSLTLAGTDSTTMTFPATSSNVLTTGNSATTTVGYLYTSYNGGTVSSGTFTPAAANGNYQYYTNNGLHTLAVPAADSAIDILVTNGASAGTIVFTGYTVGASTGSTIATTNTNKYIISIRRINAASTYSAYALQ